MTADQLKRKLRNFPAAKLTGLAALVEHVRAGETKRLAVERFDGEPVGATEVMTLLLELGFLAGPRRAVLRP